MHKFKLMKKKKSFIEYKIIKIVAPLTWRICKDKLKWNEDAMKAFKFLKKDFTIVPILIIIHIKTIFSKSRCYIFHSWCHVIQYGSDELLHYVGFYLSKFSMVKINYEILDK